MIKVVTQFDFRQHMKEYLDDVTDGDETIFIARTNGRTATIISQEKLDWLERAVRAKEETLEFAVARDQLILRNVLPEDTDLIDRKNKNYWDQFK